MFATGGALAWGSHLQATVATSSMQSEYRGMYAGMQVTVWLSEILLPLSKRTLFFFDSQSADDLALNPVYHKRLKHTEIKYYWIREHVDREGENRTARLFYVKTSLPWHDWTCLREP